MLKSNRLTNYSVLSKMEKFALPVGSGKPGGWSELAGCITCPWVGGRLHYLWQLLRHKGEKEMKEKLPTYIPCLYVMQGSQTDNSVNIEPMQNTTNFPSFGRRTTSWLCRREIPDSHCWDFTPPPSENQDREKRIVISSVFQHRPHCDLRHLRGLPKRKLGFRGWHSRLDFCPPSNVNVVMTWIKLDPLVACFEESSTSYHMSCMRLEHIIVPHR